MCNVFCSGVTISWISFRNYENCSISWRICTESLTWMPRNEIGVRNVKKISSRIKKLAVLFFCSLSPYTLLPRGRGRGSLAVPAAPAAGRGRFHSSGPPGGHTAHRGGHSGTPGGGPGGASGVTVWVHLSKKVFKKRIGLILRWGSLEVLGLFHWRSHPMNVR